MRERCFAAPVSLREQNLAAGRRAIAAAGCGQETAATDASRAVRAGLKEHPDEPRRKGRAQRNRTIRRAMKKSVAYVSNPQARLVNYAKRHRVGERVATALVEGGADHLVNARMALTQHKRWSEHGAFNVLQVRTAHFNQRLAQQQQLAA